MKPIVSRFVLLALICIASVNLGPPAIGSPTHGTRTEYQAPNVETGFENWQQGANPSCYVNHMHGQYIYTAFSKVMVGYSSAGCISVSTWVTACVPNTLNCPTSSSLSASSGLTWYQAQLTNYSIINSHRQISHQSTGYGLVHACVIC